MPWYQMLVKEAIVYFVTQAMEIRADSRFVPSQWETVLLCNDVSHWLGSNLESALGMVEEVQLLMSFPT